MNALTKLALLTALAGPLAGCNLIPLLANDLTVVNLCDGPNTTVDVYANGVYQGAVTYSGTFYGFPTGTLALRAVGTGAGGDVFEDTEYINSDVIWTLCP